MNCHKFSSIVAELARMDPRNPACRVEMVREALGHADSCERCAVHLSDQLELSALLHSVATNTATPAPSSEHSAALRSAFRQQFSPSVDTGDIRPTRIEWKPWAGAIAAMFLVTVAGMVALQRLLPGLSQESAVGNPGPPATTILPAAPGQTRQGESSTQWSSHLPERPAAIALRHGVDESQSTAEAADAVALTTAPPPAPTELASQPTATEFIALPYAGDPMLSGGGLVVRVEVSGAALQSLGIPQSMGIPITGVPAVRRMRADLILGLDGVARAIRLVQ